MLTAKGLIEILKQYDDDTPVLLYDSNIEGFEYQYDGETKTTKANLPHNSFENILECHINKVMNKGVEMLVKRNMINPKTNEVVAILAHPDEPKHPSDNVYTQSVKGVLISPDPIMIYEKKE